MSVGHASPEPSAQEHGYDYFARWRDNGTLEQINDRLVGAIRQLEAPSEELDPSAASIDSQTVKTS